MLPPQRLLCVLEFADKRSLVKIAQPITQTFLCTCHRGTKNSLCILITLPHESSKFIDVNHCLLWKIYFNGSSYDQCHQYL